MRARVLGCAPSGKIVPKIYDLSLAIGELTMYRVSRVRVILVAHDGTLAAMRRHLFAENFVHPGNRLLHPCCEAHQTVCCGTPLLSGIRRRLSLCHVHESSAARIGRCLHLPDGQRVGARATASQSASRENQGKQTP